MTVVCKWQGNRIEEYWTDIPSPGQTNYNGGKKWRSIRRYMHRYIHVHGKELRGEAEAKDEHSIGSQQLQFTLYNTGRNWRNKS